MKTTITCVLLLLLAGCASAPLPAGEAPRGPSLFTWSAFPEASEVEDFARRARAWQADAPLLRALVRAERDLAHGLWLRTEDRALRVALAAASDEPLYASSEALRDTPEHALARTSLRAAIDGRDVRPARALEQAREARAAFEAIGDPVWAAEARLTLAGLEPAASAKLSSPVAAQVAPLRLLQLSTAWQRSGSAEPRAFREAAMAAERSGHWTALQRLEALRSLGVAGNLDPGFQLAWPRLLAQVALQRRRPLLAVRHGLRALRAREALGGDTSADRVLLARAYLAAGRKEAALVEAQTAVDAAPTQASQAPAHAALGDALCAHGRDEAAAEAYAAAEVRYANLGDGPASTRQAINRCLALLRCGELERAEAALPARSLRLVGPHAADLAARRTIARSLVLLIKGDLHPRDAADRIDAALGAARGAGCVDVAQSYTGLVERLRGRANHEGSGG